MAIQPEDPNGGNSRLLTDTGESPDWPASPGSVAATTGRPGWRRWLTMAALVLGLAGLTASVAGLVVQLLPRRFTSAQQQQIQSWESLRRWRAMPAGQIFPRTLSYELPGYAFDATTGLQLTARRIGIGIQSSCPAAVDPAAAAVLGRQGCQELLRATYTDATRSLVVTVGVAVMPGMQAVTDSVTALTSQRAVGPGVQPLAFPHTLAAGFSRAQRQLSLAVAGGTYLVLSTAGYSDDKPRVPVSTDGYADAEMLSFANGIARAVAQPLAARPAPPACPGTPGC